ncbi:MAG: hypothetical protein ACYDCL_18570 [Myxococcales bacterium]
MKELWIVAIVGLASCASSARADETQATAPAAAPAAAAKTEPKAAKTEAPAKKMEKKAGEQTIQGELVDLACYLEHGGRGEKHKACATSCAQSGLPIGLLDKHGKLFLVIGDHKPMNAQLADKMGDTVKATGKISTRSGMKLIEISSVE